jgi:AcrR family transcriptional regulator
VAHSTAAQAPSRRPQISREYLAEHRRRRIVDAVAEALHEFGRPGASVTNVVRLAGTARNTFYDVFRSTEDCIAYGGGIALEELFVSLEGQDGQGGWAEDLDDAITGFYESVLAGPLLSELLLIHCASCRLDEGRDVHRAAQERFMALLGRGRAEFEAGRGVPLPPSTEEYFSHAIVSLATSRLRTRDLEGLRSEAGYLARLIEAFYLGPTGSAKG